MADYAVAVTGGVASGKSLVTALFQACGVVVADADLAARTVVAPGGPALDEIVAGFGTDAMSPDGTLDRVRMRALVFSDEAARRRLEAITHPRIRALLREQCAEADSAYVVVAVPLLAETGARHSYDWLDRILVVDAPERVQRLRLMARDGVDASMAQRMIDAQASRGQRLALATDVIVNDGTAGDLDAPVRLLDRLFRQLAQAP